MGSTLANVLANDFEVRDMTESTKILRILMQFLLEFIATNSGIFCIITVLVPDDAVFETLIIFLISKTMISASFLIIYPFAGELYPTQVRGVGIVSNNLLFWDFSQQYKLFYH